MPEFHTSPSGARKEVKTARASLVPVEALFEVLEAYGKGAEKYDPPSQWRDGYDWSLSFDALQRHAWQFWGGEDRDAATGIHHLASVVFHALTLMTFEKERAEYDDRIPTGPSTTTGSPRPVEPVVESTEWVPQVGELLAVDAYDIGEFYDATDWTTNWRWRLDLLENAWGYHIFEYTPARWVPEEGEVVWVPDWDQDIGFEESEGWDDEYLEPDGWELINVLDLGVRDYPGFLYRYVGV